MSRSVFSFSLLFRSHLGALTLAAIASIVLAALSGISARAQAGAGVIGVFRPDGETAAVEAQIKDVLASIPEPVRRRVFDSGCRVVIVPTVAEYIGAGYSDRPRGYVRGGGYDNADGLFYPVKNELLVSERVSYLNGAPQPADRIGYVVRHEFGHAFDYYLGKAFGAGQTNATGLDAFINVQTREANRLSNSERAVLAYFCQEGRAGASETFAELFCLHCLAQDRWSEYQKSLVRAFPETRRLVEQAISSPESVAGWH